LAAVQTALNQGKRRAAGIPLENRGLRQAADARAGAQVMLLALPM
jgi:hypothetical protein